MGLHIICGRSHSGKSTYIMDLVREKTLRGDKIILAVPEQFTHIAEKKLLHTTGKIMDGYIEISSFKRLADRTRVLTGDFRNNIISTTGKTLVISDVLDKTELMYYKNSASMQGFVDVCLNTVSEFKKHNIYPSDIEKMIEEIKDEKLKLKLSDLKNIYSSYEEEIHKSYIDTDDILDILSDILTKTDIYNDFTFFFDEFSTFIPQERKIISHLLNKCKDVYITLCIDKSMDNAVFSPCISTLNQLKNICIENGYEAPEIINLDNSYYESEELSFIEENLFNYPTKTYDKDIKDVELIRANNPYSEVECVGAKIVSLVRDKGYRYNDICVIASDVSVYQHIFKNVFPKLNIPYFMDNKTPVLDHNIVLFVINVLDVYLENYSYESIFNFLKSGFIDIPVSDVALLENFILSTNAGKNSWLFDEKWNSLVDAYNADLNEKSIISSIRDNYVLPLAKFHDKIKGRNKCKDLVSDLYDYLLEINLDSTIAGYIDRFKENGDIVRYRQYESVWNIIIRVFDEIINVFSEKTISVSKLRNYLFVAFSHQSIGIIPTSVDEVMIGDIARTRTGKVKALFVLGANEGLFPMPAKEENIINDKDKIIIGELGYNLPNSSDEQAFFNQFLIYRIFTMPMNKICISYSSSDSNFATLAPSFSVGRLKKMFPEIENDYGFDESYELDFIGDSEITLENMISAMAKKRIGCDIDKIWESVFCYYEKKYPELINKINKFFDYKKEADVLLPQYVKKHTGDEMYTTISRLQKYSACKYSYFLSYMLSLKERPVSEISGLDVGRIAHSMLEKICKDMVAKSISFDNMPDGYIESEVKSLINEYLSDFGVCYDDLTKRQLYSLERLEDVLILSFRFIQNQIKESGFKPYGYEITFSDDNIGCIKINLPDGKCLNLTGKIDRVDTYETEDGRYIRVIDYKTGKKTFNINDIVHCTDIQLMMYLDALVESDENNKYGGAFFFCLDDYLLKSDHDEEDGKIEEKMENAMKLKGIVLDKAQVIEAFDKATVNRIQNKATHDQFKIISNYLKITISQLWMSLQNGNIDINPYLRSGSSPCTYCSYTSVCRFASGTGSYNELENLDKEEAWAFMKGEVDRVDQ